MTIEEHIKKAMVDCPLTEQQEDKLLLGLENYLNEIEQVKNCYIPAVVGRSEQLKAISDLKDFAYEVCPLHREDDLEKIVGSL
jgi:hypothetical protein